MRAFELEEPDQVREPLELVVYLMPGVYSRFRIRLDVGPRRGVVDLRSATVTYPQPFREDGSISGGCFGWIAHVVTSAARTLGHRMCLVLSADRAVYVEPDGRVLSSKVPPSGGLPINLFTDEPAEPLPAAVTICSLCK
jgi:hypothetical protein